jgi:acyl-coenzyme A synthetase/AMP-(fatty) acid ligase
MTNYEETRSSFTIDVPERFNFVGDVLHRRATETPEKLALIAVEPDGTTTHRYTFGALAERTHRAARVLRALGVGTGDKVFIQLPRIVEWHVSLLACIQIGAVPMPATTQLMAKDQAYRITRAGAAAAICDPEAAARLDEVADTCPTLATRIVVGVDRPGWTNLADAMRLVDADPALVAPTRAEDPLLLYFTSGTTGGPKMVQHLGSYALGHEITARFWHDLSEDDIHWTVSDTGWAKAAWGKLFGQWEMGAAVVMWNIVGKPDLGRLLELIAELGVTSFCAPPTLYRAFVQMDLSTYDFSTLRHCTSAGEPLNPEVIEVWNDATGTAPYDGYGQTETVCLVANYPALEIRPGSMGKPAPGMDVDVVDDDGSVCAEDEEGHIAVRTDPWPVGLFEGYWHDEEQTASVFRNGWYYTGDRAYRDADGYFWFVGRADDVILSAAYRIGPFEVESALLEHEAVAEAAVVGKPDQLRGNIVKAYVVLSPGHTSSDELVAELQDHVKAVTAPYKYPREIDFVDELPKTISGKIRRVALRETARAEASTPARTDEPRDEDPSRLLESGASADDGDRLDGGASRDRSTDGADDPDGSGDGPEARATHTSADAPAAAADSEKREARSDGEAGHDEEPRDLDADDGDGDGDGDGSDQPRWRW